MEMLTGNSILIAGAILTPLCIIIVALRFLARYKTKAQLRWDDWLIIPALATLIGMTSLMFAAVRMGAFNAVPSSSSRGNVLRRRDGGPPAAAGGRMPLSPADIKQMSLELQMEGVFQLLNIISLGFLKCSVILFYRRIFCTGHGRWFDIVTKVLIVCVVIWATGFVVGDVASCPGRITGAAAGDPNGPCGPTANNNITGPRAFVYTDVAMDLIILVFPMPAVWRLQISTQKKLALSAVFSLGGVACLSAILRLVGFEHSFGSAQAIGDPEEGSAVEQIAIAGTTMIFWSQLESGVALIAACLPTLRILFTRRTLDDLAKTRPFSYFTSSSSRSASSSADASGSRTSRYTGGSKSANKSSSSNSSNSSNAGRKSSRHTRSNIGSYPGDDLESDSFEISTRLDSPRLPSLTNYHHHPHHHPHHPRHLQPAPADFGVAEMRQQAIRVAEMQRLREPRVGAWAERAAAGDVDPSDLGLAGQHKILVSSRISQV